MVVKKENYVTMVNYGGLRKVGEKWMKQFYRGVCSGMK